MKKWFYIVGIIFFQITAWSWKENIFSHGIFGWNMSVRLDSANWDIQSAGGDKNQYIYDESGKIFKNIRTTGANIDTIVFHKESSDSLTWNNSTSLENNWIKYTPNGFHSMWTGYSTQQFDTLSITSDTIIYTKSSQYLNDGWESSSKIGNFDEDVNYYTYLSSDQGVSDTSTVFCIDNFARISCTQNDTIIFSFSSAQVNNVRSDTLWMNNIPQQSWHYTILAPSTTIMDEPRSDVLIEFINQYDLLGRLKSKQKQ